MKIRTWILAIAAAALLWAGLDLFRPVRADIRVFDPIVVARLDTVMWRSYYDRKPIALFFQLAELMRTEFHVPWLRSHVIAGRAARAAFVFKKGHNRSDYEKAIPDLVAYFAALRKLSVSPFDVKRSAELELEWWIVHRERLGHGGERLERALAEAAAEFYRVPVDLMADYARERTVAMDIRDTQAAAGGVSEADWRFIEQHLEVSWSALASVVRDTPAGTR